MKWHTNATIKIQKLQHTNYCLKLNRVNLGGAKESEVDSRSDDDTSRSHARTATPPMLIKILNKLMTLLPQQTIAGTIEVLSIEKIMDAWSINSSSKARRRHR